MGLKECYEFNTQNPQEMCSFLFSFLCVSLCVVARGYLSLLRSLLRFILPNTSFFKGLGKRTQ